MGGLTGKSSIRSASARAAGGFLSVPPPDCRTDYRSSSVGKTLYDYDTCSSPLGDKISIPIPASASPQKRSSGFRTRVGNTNNIGRANPTSGGKAMNGTRSSNMFQQNSYSSSQAPNLEYSQSRVLPSPLTSPLDFDNLPGRNSRNPMFWAFPFVGKSLFARTHGGTPLDEGDDSGGASDSHGILDDLHLVDERRQLAALRDSPGKVNSRSRAKGVESGIVSRGVVETRKKIGGSISNNSEVYATGGREGFTKKDTRGGSSVKNTILSSDRTTPTGYFTSAASRRWNSEGPQSRVVEPQFLRNNYNHFNAVPVPVAAAAKNHRTFGVTHVTSRVVPTVAQSNMKSNIVTQPQVASTHVAKQSFVPIPHTQIAGGRSQSQSRLADRIIGPSVAPFIVGHHQPMAPVGLPGRTLGLQVSAQQQQLNAPQIGHADVQVQEEPVESIATLAPMLVNEIDEDGGNNGANSNNKPIDQRRQQESFEARRVAPKILPIGQQSIANPPIAQHATLSTQQQQQQQTIPLSQLGPRVVSQKSLFVPGIVASPRHGFLSNGNTISSLSAAMGVGAQPCAFPKTASASVSIGSSRRNTVKPEDFAAMQDFTSNAGGSKNSKTCGRGAGSKTVGMPCRRILPQVGLIGLFGGSTSAMPEPDGKHVVKEEMEVMVDDIQDAPSSSVRIVSVFLCMTWLRFVTKRGHCLWNDHYGWAADEACAAVA